MTPMNFQPVEAACAFGWRNYMLLHSGVRENDDRRSALYRCINDLYDSGKHDFTGKRDFNALQVAATVYLKKLDELGDDREARVAAEALAKFRSAVRQ
jgi:hypothetical protein